MSETLQLEAGKFYRTRRDRKAFVVGKLDASLAGGFPWVAQVDGNYFHFTEEGRFCSKDSNEALDLIAEWREPPTVAELIALLKDVRTTAGPVPARYAGLMGRIEAAIAAHSQGATP